MLFTFCSVKFSVSYNFTVNSACSSLSTDFLKAIVMPCFLLLFFVIEVLQSSLIFLSFSYSYNHLFCGSMLFLLVFQFLLQVV